MSNTPSLLPCPFCSKTHSLIMGAASEMWDADEHGQYPHTETYAVFCDASTDGRKGGCGGAGGYRLTKDDAIEAWNRRVPAVTPSDAEIDAQWRESVAKHETTAAFVRDFTRAVLAKWGAPQPAPVAQTDAEDAARMDWLEQQVRQSRTGVSFDYGRSVDGGLVTEKGYRFMKHHLLCDRMPTLRAAIDAARKQGANHD